MYKDKIQDMYVGQEFKNYKELCEFLGEKIKSGKGKQLQWKEWKRYFSFEKEGNKIIITEIFDEPKKKVDHRGGNNCKPYKHFDIGIYKPDRTMDKLKGVYIIQLDNKVYIGSTTNGFRLRYRQHCMCLGSMEHTYNLLKEGATFDILWIADENDTERTIRTKEAEYIEQYAKDGYDMCNSHSPVVLSERKPKPPKSTKPQYKRLRINKEDYEKAFALLMENGIRIAT